MARSVPFGFRLGAVALISTLCAGCQSSTVIERFPAYGQAISKPPVGPPKPPPVFTRLEEIPDGELVPYERLQIVSEGSFESRVRQLWRESLRDMPDAIVCFDEGTILTGATSVYWGFGISSSTPQYGVRSGAILLRECPAFLPIRMNESGLLTLIEDGAEVSGLVEGDTILSIDGQSVSTSPGWRVSSEHVVGRLSLSPGQQVKVIGIRPGTGRVSGTVKAIGNRRRYRKLSSLIDVSREEIEMYLDDGGRQRWSLTQKSDDS